MILRVTDFNKYRALFDRIADALCQTVIGDKKDRVPIGNKHNAWYMPRRVEYAWALEASMPAENSKILDIGSNQQFPFALLSMYETAEIWEHHTFTDLQSMRAVRVLAGAEEGLGLSYDGWADSAEIYPRFRDRLNMLLGVPQELEKVLIPEYFDIIYNISTMEHVEPENIRPWLDAMWKWLKPGGVMVMTMDHPIDGYSGISFWDHRELFFDFIEDHQIQIEQGKDSFMDPEFDKICQDNNVHKIVAQPEGLPDVDVTLVVNGIVLRKAE